jgi:hypothetical protein
MFLMYYHHHLSPLSSSSSSSSSTQQQQHSAAPTISIMLTVTIIATTTNHLPHHFHLMTTVIITSMLLALLLLLLSLLHPTMQYNHSLLPTTPLPPFFVARGAASACGHSGTPAEGLAGCICETREERAAANGKEEGRNSYSYASPWQGVENLTLMTRLKRGLRC